MLRDVYWELVREAWLRSLEADAFPDPDAEVERKEREDAAMEQAYQRFNVTLGDYVEGFCIMADADDAVGRIVERSRARDASPDDR